MAIVGLRLKSFMQRPLPTTDSDSKFHGVHVLFYFLPNPIADIEPMTFQLEIFLFIPGWVAAVAHATSQSTR